MSYQKKFYSNYVSTHISPRKGGGTLEEFKSRAICYNKQFGKFLPVEKTSAIIDIGCGNGSVVWWLEREGYVDVVGVDISEEQIQQGFKCGITNLEQTDLTQYLKEKKKSYDLIFARDIIEHFNKNKIVEVLNVCYESLKSGGAIIIQVPNGESPFGNRIRYGDFTHEIAFTKSSLSQLLRMSNFVEISIFPSSPIIYGLKSFFRFVLWKVIEAFYKFLLFIEIGRGEKIVTQNIIALAKKQ